MLTLRKKAYNPEGQFIRRGVLTPRGWQADSKFWSGGLPHCRFGYLYENLNANSFLKLYYINVSETLVSYALLLTVQ
jgi:hypothetical protein